MIQMLMETCTSDVLVGLKEVAELLLEGVDQGVVGAVEEEGLHAQDDEEEERGGCLLVWKAPGRPLSALTSEG